MHAPLAIGLYTTQDGGEISAGYNYSYILLLLVGIHSLVGLYIWKLLSFSFNMLSI